MYRSTSSTINLKVAVEVSPLVAKPATHQVEAVLVLPAWLKIIIGLMEMKLLGEWYLSRTPISPADEQAGGEPWPLTSVTLVFFGEGQNSFGAGQIVLVQVKLVLVQVKIVLVQVKIVLAQIKIVSELFKAVCSFHSPVSEPPNQVPELSSPGTQHLNHHHRYHTKSLENEIPC